MQIGESSFPRRQTRQLMVGNVPVGGGAPITVQSMTITKTADVEGTLQQIYALAAARALAKHTDLSARDIAVEALRIAGEICIYSNQNIVVEEL